MDIEKYSKKIVAMLAVVFLIVLFCMVSCGTKPVAKQIVHTEEQKEETKATDTLLVINNAILDSLFFHIPRIYTGKSECDSITNAKIQELLKQINTLKKSGNNELGFKYDSLNKVLIAFGKLQETVNSKVTNKETLTTNTVSVKEKEIPVKYVPTFYKVLAALGLLFVVFITYRILKIFRPDI